MTRSEADFTSVFVRQALEVNVMRAKKRTIERIRNHLEEHFLPEHPNAKIMVGEGYKENIHLMIISEDFADVPSRKRDDMVWPILEQLPNKDFFRISLCLLLTKDELPDGVEAALKIPAW